MPQKPLESRLLSAAEIGTWEFDVQRNELSLSPLAASLHGVDQTTPAVYEPAVLLRMVLPEDRMNVQSAVRRSVDDQQPFECSYRIVAPLKETRSVMVKAAIEHCEQSGRITRVAGIVFDNTQQRESRSQILAVEHRYRHLFEHVSEGYALVDLTLPSESDNVEFTVREVNPAINRLYRLQPRATVSWPILIGSDEATWTSRMTDVFNNRAPVEFISERTLDQHVLAVSVSILNMNSSIQAAVCIRDITAEAQVQASLHDLAEGLATTDRERTAFLASLSHELRNPLAPIRLGLEHLQEAGMVDSSARTTVLAMQRQVEHMSRLLDDLLDVQRMQQDKLVLQKRFVRLGEAVSLALDISRPSISAAGHTYAQNISEHGVEVWVDPDRIAQAIANLMINAARYTHDGGDIRLKGVADRSGVVITVSDTGVGLSCADKSQVFDLFRQVAGPGMRQQGGLGVGLTLVRQLITLHGGSVQCHSDGIGKGSEFTIRLPAECVREAPSRSKNVEQNLMTDGTDPVKSMRVLVVDDSSDIRTAIVRLLKRKTFDVDSAVNGGDALDKVPTFRPDVALIDIGLPDISGYDVARQIRKMPEWRQIRLVALTGWGSPEDVTRAREAGFDEHLTKPVSGRDVISSLEKVSNMEAN